MLASPRYGFPGAEFREQRFESGVERFGSGVSGVAPSGDEPRFGNVVKPHFRAFREWGGVAPQGLKKQFEGQVWGVG